MKELKICHLYGDLLNTYGDNGSLLVLQWRARQKGFNVSTELVSIDEHFDSDAYDIVFLGGGQDYEQYVISKDIQNKKDSITRYIENGGVFIGICGGFQLLGHYYTTASGKKIDGISALNHYTLNQVNNRFIGDITIIDKETGEKYEGYENHNGRTFLGEGVGPLGEVELGFGNNGEDKTEGARYKNVFCSYLHGPLLVRNVHLADRIIDIAYSQQSK